MQDVAFFVAGIVVGVVLALVATYLRRGSVTDLGAAAPDTASAVAGSAVAGSAMVAPAPLVTADPELQPTDNVATDAGRITRRVVRRIETKIGPGGAMSIIVDGTTYRHLDEIPDARVRDQVRTILQTVPADVADPKNRQRVEDELRDAGIEPEPPGT